MNDIWESFCAVGFMPHGHCYLWSPRLVWTQALSDGLIGLSYLSIPVALIYFVRKRRDLEFGWILSCFAAFIVACGITHVLEVWNIWHADYWVSAVVKAVTAVISLVTAVLLVRLIPTALAIPSGSEMKRLNLTLEQEVLSRSHAERSVHQLNTELENRVIDRTAQLHAANEDLKKQMVDRKAAEDAFRASEGRYRTLFEYAPEGIVIADARSNYIDANPSMCRLLGYRRNELIGLHASEIVVQSEVRHIEPALEVIQAKSEYHREWQFRRKDGSVVWGEVIATQMPDGNLMGIVRDVTERKVAEEKLKVSAKEIVDLKTALDEHAIVAITNPQGKITFVNDKFCAISQYSREELIGQDHRIINSGFHSKEFIRDLWVTIGQGRIWRGEIKNRAKDGSYYWVATTIVPFLDDDGKPRQYVAIRADITERKLAEAEITRLNTELEERVAQRTAQLEAANRELEAFSYSVSHDLRAPLRGIDGFARILGEDHGPHLNDDGRRMLGIVSSESKRMGQLIDDLLGFSRMNRQQLAMSPLDMEALARSVFKGLMVAAPKHAPQLVLKPMPFAMGDRPTVRQVLVNLLGNAVKFTARQSEPVIEMGGSSEEGTATFYVKDNGVGFDEKYMSKLFGVFQRLHSEADFEGTGVGLALVQRIVHRHGGRVWADGRPGVGATFYFTLPEAKKGQP
jgi:PAS domain S-box-containing protein